MKLNHNSIEYEFHQTNGGVVESFSGRDINKFVETLHMMTHILQYSVLVCRMKDVFMQNILSNQLYVHNAYILSSINPYR